MRRRDFLGALTGGAGASLLAGMMRKVARADSPSGRARRLIVFYFPDGVPGVSSDGEPSLWNCSGTETSFQLSDVLASLTPYKDRCVFLQGLSMGQTDVGSHPGGAKKLLTAVDGGNGESLDQVLARTVGAAAPNRHLYLGVMANQNNASGDKHISYVAPGRTISPEDDPLRAFQRLFSGAGSGGATLDGGTEAGGAMPNDFDKSVLDTALADLSDLRGRLGATEKTKLDLHADALREVERRITGMATGGMPVVPPASCMSPQFNPGIDAAALYDPARFPRILRAQMDLTVQAMACDLTHVGVIQASIHTSDLIMSRFAGTAMYDPTFDMRSHQASHYGSKHDPNHREFHDYVLQCKWWVEQFAYLVDQLAKRPEGAGTMLDSSLVLLCSEVSDGNTHSHDDMPFILAGGGGGAVRTGRLLQFNGRRHADLLLAIARAMGSDLTQFGDASQGPLPGLLA